MHAVSALLTNLKSSLKEETISFGDILHKFEDRSLAFFLFLFALPAAVPLPGLGINLVIAMPLVLLTAQQMIGKHQVWFPHNIRKKEFKRSTLEKMIDKALPWMRRLEILIKPRLTTLTNGPFKPLIGFFGLLMALSVCIPLPLTNTVPSFGIALMAIGVMTRDGLAVLAGAVIGLLWIGMLTAAVVFVGIEGIDMIKETIKSFL